MAILQLHSTNPQLSYLIKKNPERGLVLKTVRKGMAYGWYSEPDCYTIYFKDADNEISFREDREEVFEYLNLSQYNSPLVYLNLISEYLTPALKETEDEQVYQHKVVLPMIHLQREHYLGFFRTSFPEYEFVTELVSDRSYQVTISTQQSLAQLLHLVQIFFLFFSLFSKEYLDVSESLLRKYIHSLQVIDAPFYIRNLFVRNFLKSRKLFKEFKEALQATKRYQIDFAFGGTAMQRREFIREQLELQDTVVDIGCGEGFYAFNLAPKLAENKDYIAIDIDEAILAAVRSKAEKREVLNLLPYASLEDYLVNYEGEAVEVILTEVIEHMSLKQAASLIKQVCRQLNFERFILTTPNQDFNQFYEIPATEMRHEDHKWELGQAEFTEWLLEFVDSSHFTVEFINIGDQVNQISTTQGAIIKPRKLENKGGFSSAN